MDGLCVLQGLSHAGAGIEGARVAKGGRKLTLCVTQITVFAGV